MGGATKLTPQSGAVVTELFFFFLSQTHRRPLCPEIVTITIHHKQGVFLNSLRPPRCVGSVVPAMHLPWKQLCLVMFDYYFTELWMFRSQLVHRSVLELWWKATMISLLTKTSIRNRKWCWALKRCIHANVQHQWAHSDWYIVVWTELLARSMLTRWKFWLIHCRLVHNPGAPPSCCPALLLWAVTFNNTCSVVRPWHLAGSLTHS